MSLVRCILPFLPVVGQPASVAETIDTTSSNCDPSIHSLLAARPNSHQNANSFLHRHTETPRDTQTDGRTLSGLVYNIENDYRPTDHRTISNICFIVVLSLAFCQAEFTELKEKDC